MAGNSAEPGRSVTSKIVAILLTFHDGNEHSLTEIARLTCLPVSTAHRLVTELAGWGVLERTDESRFRIGLPIRPISHRRSYTPAILESARRILEDLVTAARTGARLGVLAGPDVAYIEKRCDHSPVTTFAQTPRLPPTPPPSAKHSWRSPQQGILDRIAATGLKSLHPEHADRSRTAAPDPGQHPAHPGRGITLGTRTRDFSGSRSRVRIGGMAVAALELTVTNLRTDLQHGKFRADDSRPRALQRTRYRQPRRLLRNDHRAACAE